MITKIFISALTLFLTTASATAENHKSNNDVHLTPVMGCYKRAEVENYLHNGKYDLLLKGTAADGRVSEVWISEFYTATLAHDNLNTCVTNVTKNTVYNPHTLNIIKIKH